jgi:hypothetical protein
MPRPTSTPDLLPGELRLLHDIAAVQAMVDGRRRSARERLEDSIGVDLARALCASLTESAARAA